MKNLISYFLSIGIAFLMASGVAAAGKRDGCNPQGSWISYDDGMPTWIAGLHGQSASSGTNELEYPAFGVNFGTPPTAGTKMRGVWERTGGNTFVYTMLGYSFDSADGTPTWMNRMSGTLTLGEDCNSMAVTATVNVFFCDEYGVCPDPYGECLVPVNEYAGGDCLFIVIEPSTGYRVVLE